MTLLFASAGTFARGTNYKLAYVALALVDLALTLYALGHGYTELNPLVAGMSGNLAGLLVAKGLVPIAIAYLAPAKLLAPSIAILAVIAGWNFSALAGFS